MQAIVLKMKLHRNSYSDTLAPNHKFTNSKPFYLGLYYDDDDYDDDDNNNNKFIITVWCRFISEELIVTQRIKKFLASMETEGSLLSSQKPATGPYLKPIQSSPHTPYYFKIRNIPEDSHLQDLF
jgi:hypothetical protein